MLNIVRKSFQKIYGHPVNRYLVLLLGCLFFLPALAIYFSRRKNDGYHLQADAIRQSLTADGTAKRLQEEIRQQVEKKYTFFNKNKNSAEMKKEEDRIFTVRMKEMVEYRMRREHPQLRELSFYSVVDELLSTNGGMGAFIVLGFPAFLLLLILSNSYIKYIFDRVLMMLFVVFGVTFLVFTILYISPMDAAVNVLGDMATPDQVEQFRVAYGLNQPYFVQLLEEFKGLITFDLGQSFIGGEDVFTSLMNRFPITLELTIMTLILAVAIAIPSGIISALKPYSALDYVIMLIALLGLSIPGFWFGLLLILNLSIKVQLLPATFVAGSWTSFIMPSIVLGTGLAASTARMTRSSMLEIIKSDYIVTARAKGLPKSKVIFRHALGNAMIPIVTVIGIQFGSMLGGAAVTEKVFNVNGIGSYIVDKQFIPDTPVVIAGVVYVAIVVSLANLFVDILYAFLDPRIKAKLKSY